MEAGREEVEDRQVEASESSGVRIVGGEMLRGAGKMVVELEFGGLIG